MINFLFASIIAANIQNIRPLPPKIATAAAKININTAAKLDGSIASLGTNSFVVNGITVNIASNTVLLRKFGAKSVFSEFSVNDQVQVVGKWTGDTKTAVNARVVRNLSIQKRHGTFVGTISSLSATGFVLLPLQRPSQNVTVSSTTKYVNRQNSSISFSDLKIGQKVMVRGMWDNKANTVTQVALVKNFALGQKKP
jgi:hypothetical protein